MLVLNPLFEKGFKFAILQESEKLLNLIERLHSSLKGFDKTREPFLRVMESSSIPAVSQSSRDFFCVDFCGICQIKNINLNKISIIL